MADFARIYPSIDAARKKRTNNLIAYSFIAAKCKGFTILTLVPIIMGGGLVLVESMQW